MTSMLALQLILAVTQYCQGPGWFVEYNQNPKLLSSTSRFAEQCFKKIWDCGHNTKDASSIPFDTHNCITKHQRGELK